MNTLEALHQVREGLQIDASGSPFFDLRGREPRMRHTQVHQVAHHAVVNAFQSVLRPEVSFEVVTAERMASQIARTTGYRINAQETLLSRDWLYGQGGNVSRGMSRMGLALERAVKVGAMPDVNAIDPRRFAIGFVAQSLVTSAILDHTEHCRSDVGVYMSPLEVARLRADNPDFSIEDFGSVLERGGEIKRLLPAVFGRIREDEMDMSTFEKAYPDVRADLLAVERQRIEALEYQEWPLSA